jgi:hypothetical protein
MFFMAYSLPLTVAVDINYWSGNNPPLNQEKGRRALRRRPCPATAGSWGRIRCVHFAMLVSTEHLVDAILREYEVTVLR